MNIIAVIPSRFDSSRFKGKPLVKIGGVTMIERVYRQVEKSGKFNEIIVATDDNRIERTVTEFGGRAIMTSKNHLSGTDRIWEVVRLANCEGVINIQGDEPLISDCLISELYDLLATGEDDVVTAANFNDSYDDFFSSHIVKVVLSGDSRGLYFSRSPIPYMPKEKFSGFFHHVGIYGYQKSALKFFVNRSPSPLELAEKLEQLRFLENNIHIKILKTSYRSVGVDVPEDVVAVEKQLRGDHE